MTEYNKAVEQINNISQFQKENGFIRSGIMLDRLKRPEKNLKIIHIAGSNGKGSVSAFINSILMEHGFKTGLFTSPHLVDIRERIKINNKMISKEKFAYYYDCVKNTDKDFVDSEMRLAYFDYLLGIALCYFNDENVDYVILETGLGGKLDATNAISDKILSIITTISLEHTAILGDTLSKIAAEKAGIISKNSAVCYSDKNKEVSDEIMRHIRDKKIQFYVPVKADMYQIRKNTTNSIDFSLSNEYYKNDCFSLKTSAIYQAENCSVALTAVAMLDKMGFLFLNKKKAKKAVAQTIWECRMQQITSGIYIDGAHNPEGIDSFIKTVKSFSDDNDKILLFSVVKDKNFPEMIRMLDESKLFCDIIVAGMNGKRKLDADVMLKEFIKDSLNQKKCSLHECDSVYEGIDKGIDIMKKENKKYFFITGSLYLAGEVKKYFDNRRETD